MRQRSPEPGGRQSFDDWFSRRPSVLRNTWRRRLRRLMQHGRVALQLTGSADPLDRTSDPDDLKRVFQRVK